MLFISEGTCVKIDMDFIFAFSDWPIHLKIGCWFSKFQDLKIDFLLPLCQKKEVMKLQKIIYCTLK